MYTFNQLPLSWEGQVPALANDFPVVSYNPKERRRNVWDKSN